MMDDPIEHMTADQIEVYKNHMDGRQEEYKLCLNNYAWAKKAEDVSLPAISPSGRPVIHRSRMLMRAIAEYWYYRGKQVERWLEHDERESVQKETGVYLVAP